MCALLQALQPAVLRIGRVQRAGEPALLRDIEARQRVEEVRLVDGSARLRLVQERDLRPDELDAVCVTASQIRDVEADARIVTVRPAFALAFLEEQLETPRARGCLARPDLVVCRVGGRLAALPRNEGAVVRDLDIPFRESVAERLLVASQHRDIDVGVRTRLVADEHVESTAAADPPRDRDRREQLLHLFEAERLPPLLRRRSFRVLHQNPSLYTRMAGMRYVIRCCFDHVALTLRCTRSSLW